MSNSKENLKEIYDLCPESIKKHFRREEFLAGELIVKQDEKHDYACIIIDGKAKISVMTDEGKSIVVSIMSEWQLFGETELFDDNSKEFDVEAITKCKVIIINKSILLEWLEYDFNLVKYTLAQLSQKLNESAKALVANTLYTLEYRFSVLLLTYCDEECAVLEVDKELAAQLLGTTLRSINRLIEKFEKMNLIDYKNGVIKIRDFEKIKNKINNLNI